MIATRRPLLRGPDAERALDVAALVFEASCAQLDASPAPPESIARYGGAALVAEALARAGRVDPAWVSALLRSAFVFARDRIELYHGAAGLLVVLGALDPDRTSLAAARTTLCALLAKSLEDAPTGDPGVPASFDLIRGVAGRAIALGAATNGALESTTANALRAWAHAFADAVERRLAAGDALNLGVSHGLPGVLAALNVALPGDRDLSGRYVRAIVGASHGAGGARRWDALWHPGRRPSARRAWCYQTAGVAAVLDDRARLDGDEALRALAADALAAILDDPEPEEWGWDAALCHGRGGVAALAWRFAARDARFTPHAERLALGVLDEFDPSAPFGYRSWNARDRLGEDRYGFLEGALGVAQFLVDAATAQERRWLPLFGLLPD